MADKQTFACKSITSNKNNSMTDLLPRAYRCSASPSPHAMLAVLLFLLDRFKHEWIACRFRSWRQTPVLVFIWATGRAQQRVIIFSPLVPIFRTCRRKVALGASFTNCRREFQCQTQVLHHIYYTHPDLINHKHRLVLTCCTTVAAGLNVLFTVFTIEIVLAGRTHIHCRTRDQLGIQCIISWSHRYVFNKQQHISFKL